ncbi:class I SAM-dependent methyltransferase [Nocardioides sp.]|uniref:class I SAM-dependent methyltransferase n=1 Tax=Nocardioides sp. TaxID=35761 RepID=UPI00286D81D4|nr:class I SAM-dependent methyltransferase [Nocardioides sp.]
MTAVEVSFSEVFASALRGHPCTVVGVHEQPLTLPVDRWTRAADADDLRLLDLCVGPTLDVGCGPGRLTEALARAGHVALGIDVVEEAVVRTRNRGGCALLRDIFDPVPGEGRWQTALLADGNIGIGGDPGALLERACALLAPGGRIVAEVAAPGAASTSSWATLESAHHRSRPFRWAVVGVDGVGLLASAVGLRVNGRHQIGQRWFVVMTQAS